MNTSALCNSRRLAGVIYLEGAVAHAARGRDGRQEGRERGYYNLHRNLNNSLFHRLIR